MATLKLNKEDLEMLFDNSDLTSDIVDRIFEQTTDAFWADVLLNATDKHKTVIIDGIKEAVEEYLDRELKHLVQKAITEEVSNAIRETIDDKLDVLLTKKS